MQVIARLAPHHGVEEVGVTDEDEYFPPPRNIRELQSSHRGRRHGDGRRAGCWLGPLVDDRVLAASDVLAALHN